METNLRKWSSMLYVLCLAMVMTMMPITTDAAETRDLVVTTSTKKQQDTSIEQLNAGAAVLVDVDVAMNDAELTTLVRKQTSDIAPIHAMDEKDTESTLVMAKVNQYVNIRKEPNQDSEKVGVLYKDCGGDILQRQDSWKMCIRDRSSCMVLAASVRYLLFAAIISITMPFRNLQTLGRRHRCV